MVEKYIAVENVAGYKVGDVVDYDLAKKWINMYKVAPVVTEDVFKNKVKVDSKLTEEDNNTKSNERKKELEKMNKDDLFELAVSAELQVDNNMPKKQILNIIEKYEEHNGVIEIKSEEMKE